MVVNYLPVGSEEATKWYTEQILGVGLRDGELHPRLHRQGRLLREAVRTARPADHRRRHQVLQVSATITHRVLTSLFRERGAPRQDDAAQRRRQLRLPQHARAQPPEPASISKTNAVTSMLDYDMGAGNVHVGPSDYVPWLTDRKYLHPHGGHVLRRASERRAEARGPGLPNSASTSSSTPSAWRSSLSTTASPCS